MKLGLTIIATVVCLAGAVVITLAVGLWSCRWLLVLVALLIALKLHAQTNTAAWTNAMSLARAQVIALTTPSPSDNINPLLASLSSSTNGTMAATQLSPLPAGSMVIFTNFLYPTNMENFAWTLQSSVDLQTWSNLMSWPKGLRSGGTMTLTNKGPKAFYRMMGK